MEAFDEILVVPFFGQGHILPSIELCKNLSSYNYQTTLIIPSHLSSSVPSSLRHHSSVHIAEISSSSKDDSSSSPPPPPPERANGPQPADKPEPGFNPFGHHNKELSDGIRSLLSARDTGPRPVCAVVDVMMSWSKEIFAEFDIPAVSFFTSGAASAAMEYASWKVKAEDLKPGEIRVIPGLPEDMALTYSDLKGARPRMPPWHNGTHGGPPGPEGFHGPPDGMKFNSHGPPDGTKFGSHGPSDWMKFNSQGPPDGTEFGSHGPPDGMKFISQGLPDGNKFSSHGPPHGPQGPGSKPPWVDESEGSIALFINTCDNLERPFLDYITDQVKKPVWGVGPLLPEQYWKSAGSILHDHELRPNRKSNYTEEEVIQWLESKPRGSVIYISFGSEVGPTLEEYAELAGALEDTNRPFIWVIQPGSGKKHGPPGPPDSGKKYGPPSTPLGAQPGPNSPEAEGYHPEGLDSKVGNRGLIIRGWAPQLLILSHPSTGGFLSHCGWNSTVEAIARGVPLLAWPIRGDQFYNAKLVVSHLKVGHLVSSFDDSSEKVKKDDILVGMERLMADEEVHEQAMTLRGKFECFPESSVSALGAFVDFIKGQKQPE